MRSATGAIFVAALMALAAPAQAQLAVGPDDALREEQRRLYDAMQETPADLDVMFRYAAVSARLQDYEQAIATLERMLIFNPDLPRVKLELGAAYFRIGSYAPSRYWFEEALASDPPPEVREKVNQFLVQIDDRTREDDLQATISFGPVWSSNYNLGPDSQLIEVLNLTGTLPASALSQDSFGLRLNAAARYVIDLQRPNTDVWITEAAWTSLRYFEDGEGDLHAGVLRSGPRLSVDDQTYGPKIQPFGAFSYVRSAGRFFYAGYGAGANYSNTLDAETAVSAGLSADWRDYASARPDNDGLYTRASVAVTERWGETGAARFELTGAREIADGAWYSNWGAGIGISLDQRLDLGTPELLSEPLRLSASARLSGAWYDEPDPAVNTAKTRRDTVLRLSASATAPLDDGWALRLEASYFDRSSNISNYEVTATELGLYVVRNF